MGRKIESYCSICGWTIILPWRSGTCFDALAALDSRPSTENRFTMHESVIRCPNCGYCSGDIEESHTEAKTVIQTTDYKEQLNNRDYPELANSFLCKAMTDNATGDLVGRTWSFIHAAWACDDDKKDDQAVLCRRRAAESLESLLGKGETIADEYEMNATIILIDLFRRSNQTANAKKLIESMRDNTTDNEIRLLLDYELVLVQNKDVKRRTVEKALKRKC